MKCMEGSKENWDLGSVGVDVNLRALEKSIWVLKKSRKFVSQKVCKPCQLFMVVCLVTVIITFPGTSHCLRHFSCLGMWLFRLPRTTLPWRVSLTSFCGGLVVSALIFRSSSLRLNPGWGHCVVFLGKTCYSPHASLHPGVCTCMGTLELNTEMEPCNGLHLESHSVGSRNELLIDCRS